MEYAGKQKERIVEATVDGALHSELRLCWEKTGKPFKLLKRKRAATSEANKIVKSGERQNGWESWRLLNIRYEPQSGIRRTHEFR